MKRDQKAAKLLDTAAEVIGRGWIQGANARDVNGNPTDPMSEGATCWCASGALTVAEHEIGLRGSQGVMTAPEVAYALEVRTRAESALRALTGEGVMSFNDLIDQTQAKVQSALHRAARLLLPPNATTRARSREWERVRRYREVREW